MDVPGCACLSHSCTVVRREGSPLLRWSPGFLTTLGPASNPFIQHWDGMSTGKHSVFPPLCGWSGGKTNEMLVETAQHFGGSEEAYLSHPHHQLIYSGQGQGQSASSGN